MTKVILTTTDVKHIQVHCFLLMCCSFLFSSNPNNNAFISKMPLFSLKPIRRYPQFLISPPPSNTFCECSLKFRTYEQKTKAIFFIFFPFFDSQMLLNPVYRHPSEAASQVTNRYILLFTFAVIDVFWGVLGNSAFHLLNSAASFCLFCLYTPFEDQHPQMETRKTHALFN